MRDSEFLQWIHDRLTEVHGENRNYGYMHKLREIIADKTAEECWEYHTIKGEIK